MEARASFGRSGISKGLIAATAVSVCLGLAVMAATVAKNAGGSTSTQTHAVSAQAASAPTSTQSQRLGGKLIDDTVAAPVQATQRHPGGHGVQP